MSRSQPQIPCHLGDVHCSSSHQIHDIGDIAQKAPQETACSQGQTNETQEHADFGSIETYQSLGNNQDLHGAHEYIKVRRLSRPCSLTISSMGDHLVLDAIPMSSRRKVDEMLSSDLYRDSTIRSQTLKSAPSPSLSAPSISSSSNHRIVGRLTKKNLEQCQQEESINHSIREFEQGNPCAGPYDAIGWIRWEGQVYAEFGNHEEYPLYQTIDMPDDCNDGRSSNFLH